LIDLLELANGGNSDVSSCQQRYDDFLEFLLKDVRPSVTQKGTIEVEDVLGPNFLDSILSLSPQQLSGFQLCLLSNYLSLLILLVRVTNSTETSLAEILKRIISLIESFLIKKVPQLFVSGSLQSAETLRIFGNHLDKWGCLQQEFILLVKRGFPESEKVLFGKVMIAISPENCTHNTEIIKLFLKMIETLRVDENPTKNLLHSVGLLLSRCLPVLDNDGCESIFTMLKDMLVETENPETETKAIMMLTSCDFRLLRHQSQKSISINRGILNKATKNLEDYIKSRSNRTFNRKPEGETKAEEITKQLVVINVINKRHNERVLAASFRYFGLVGLTS